MRRTHVLVLALAAFVAACGGAAAPTPTPTPTPTPAVPDPTPAVPDPTTPGASPDDLGPSGLDGRTFLGTSITGRVLVGGSQVRITFDSGSLSASGGCNTMGGAYRVLDGNLVADQLMTTEMACAPALMAQDAWLADLLRDAAFTLEGDTLMLSKGAVSLTLTDREEADPDRPLEGTRWVVDGLVTGGAVSSVPVGAVASITITGTQVAVEAGCNSGGGAVEIGDGSIAFGPIGITKMACDRGRMELERMVLGALAGTVDYTIEAGTLTLNGAAGGLILKAEG